MAAAIAYAIQLLGLLPSLISAGVEIKGLVSRGTAALSAMQNENRDPTPAEWDALNAVIGALRAELRSTGGLPQIPVPPAPLPVPPAPLVYEPGFGPCPDNSYGPGGPFGKGCPIV